MDDREARIRELLLRARDLEQEAEGLRAVATKLVQQVARAELEMPYWQSARQSSE